MQLIKNLKNSRGFTLIELLVVITIIGILATGGTVTYTSQIQKARDTTRITDMKALQSGLEQFYQDKTQYPDSKVPTGEFGFLGAATFGGGVVSYVPKLPIDPKNGQACNKGTVATDSTVCAYLYTSEDDNNGITGGEYKISAGLENAGNVLEKASKDAGNEPSRLEMGLDLPNGKSTVCIPKNDATSKAIKGVQAIGTDLCTVANPNALIIAGTP